MSVFRNQQKSEKKSITLILQDSNARKLVTNWQKKLLFFFYPYTFFENILTLEFFNFYLMDKNSQNADVFVARFLISLEKFPGDQTKLGIRSFEKFSKTRILKL